MCRPGLILLLTICLVDLCAQHVPMHIPFEHIPVPGTIKSALTEDITQDEYGMMWIAKDALYRYDGRTFKKYEVISNDSSLFSTREITVLFWDSVEHRLLIGTRNYGVIEYKYEHDKLVRLYSKDGAPIVTDIARTTSGILISSMTSGLFGLRNDTLMSLPAIPGMRWPSGMTVTGNKVWISCQNEVIALANDKVVRRLSFNRADGFTGANIRANCLQFDHRGQLWVGTERDGIAVVDTANMTIVRKFPHNEAPFYNAVVKIVRSRDSAMWIATKGDGLIGYDPRADRFRQFVSNDRAPGSLSGDHCTTVFFDKTGIMWVGTQGDVNKYDRGQIKFKHFNHNPTDINSLSDDNIRNVFADDNGLIYVCTSGGYLNIIDRTNSQVARIKPVVASVDTPILLLCVVPFDEDNLLVGSNVGLLTYNKLRRSFSYYAPLEKVTRGGYVRQVLYEKGNIFLIIRGAAFIYNVDSKRIAWCSPRDRIVGTSSITIDNQNRYWIGIRAGVAYKGPSDSLFTVIPLSQDESRPDSTYFLALSLQQVGSEMWVNSFNNGIYIIDLRQSPPRLTERITRRSGLVDNTVYATIPDNNGNVWITHNSGLTRYDLQTHQFVHFSVSEGLQGDEFNRLAYSSNRQGEIVIGGTNGINIFSPEKINIQSPHVNARIVDLTAHAIRSYDDDQFYMALIDGADEVSVAHDYNSLNFSFFVADYHEPSRIDLRYKLDPFDKEWIHTDKLSTHAYANLLPGMYNFSVKATAFDGSESIATVVVNITPPYWKTWWFLGLTAVVCSFLVYSVINSRVQSTKRETQRLEALLKSRTQEIEQSREELENLNRKKDLIFSILSHDLRSPLTTLKGFLGLLIDNSDSLTKEELQKYATNIRNSVTTSLDLIDNTLFWSLSQTGNIQCTPTAVPVGPLFNKIRDLYQLTADKKNITINFMPVNGLTLYADENMVYVLLRNLVSNAIKFTPEMNSINVDASQTGTTVSIKVSDHGVGMSQHEIDNIFTLDNPIVKKGTQSEKGTGLGLLLCKKFVEANNGKLVIESKLGEGSSFTVILPSA